MGNLPVRESLAGYLQKRHQSVMRRVLAQVEQSPDLEALHELLRLHDARQAVSTLLDLLIRNLADPKDRRCFYYARHRLRGRISFDIGVSQLLRLLSVHRQVVTKMVQRHFSGEPALSRRMVELIEAQLEELELCFAEGYQRAAQENNGLDAQGKYFSLFKNASEAIISFRPGQGRIIEANVQAEHLLGRSRAQILDTDFYELFTEPHREQIRWLIGQHGDTSNIRLEDLAVYRVAGDSGARLEVPISLSCNWVTIGDEIVAQAILRDVTLLRQTQRELKNYAEQLEERVAARTRELQQSEDRYRTLYFQEQRRAQHLSLINDVQQCALSTTELDIFLKRATVAIQNHFHHCDVNFFLLQSSIDFYLTLDLNRTEAPNLHSLALQESPDSAQNGEGGPASADDLVVVAQAGGYGLSMAVGMHHPVGNDALGQAIKGGATLHYGGEQQKGTPDHTHQPSTSNLFDFDNEDETNSAMTATAQDTEAVHNDGVVRDAGAVHAYRSAQSEMCIPVFIEGRAIGAIAVQSEQPRAFDSRDAVALQTVSTVIAAHLQSSHLLKEMAELNEFNETLINTLMHSMLVVDREGRIKLINDRLCQTLRLRRETLLDQPITRVFGDSVVKKYGLLQAMRSVTDEGLSHEIPEIQIWTPEATSVFDVRLFRIFFRSEARVVLLLINITQRWRKTHQLQLMHDMGRFFQASLDINRVLATVLTCITAGSALGFNRAFLLLRDPEHRRAEPGREPEVLQGAMALGPSSAEEASRIWQELSWRDLSLAEMLAAAETLDKNNPTALQKSTLDLKLDVNHPSFPAISQAINERRALLVERDDFCVPAAELSDVQRAQRNSLLELLTAPEIVVAPLVAKERVVGVVLADNLYSGAPIEADDVQLLDTLAQQAGLTIDNALTYRDLQKAQKELVSAERLVAVGEMSARVSHEIRNPLATIGGFARNVLKRPDDTDGVRRKTQVIVDEVTRLEELLSDLLDMARPRQLDLKPHDINAVVEHALLLADADIQAAGVTVEKQYADLPLIKVDRSRLLQALLNTLRNGAQAMPNGGVLEVTTRLAERAADGVPHLEIETTDHGTGISERAVQQVFDPFFSTKIRGSGLGLAVTRRIIQDHGGEVVVNSREGEGTSFIFCLPLRLVR